MPTTNVRTSPSGPEVDVDVPSTIVAPGELLGRSLNETTSGDAVPVTGAQQGEMVRFQNDIPNSDTGTLALLTIGEQTTNIQFNPVGADLTISAISLPFGKPVNLRVQRNNAQRVILTNAGGSNGIRCPGNADYVMRGNDECTIINNFGGVLVIDKASDPNCLAPETAFAANPLTFFANTFSIRNTFTAGAGGAADDVILLNGNVNMAFRILDVFLDVSTAVVGSSCTLRSATGGGGIAISSALSSASTPLTSRNSVAGTIQIAANGTVVLRRSDSGVAGTIVLLCARN